MEAEAKDKAEKDAADRIAAAEEAEERAKHAAEEAERRKADIERRERDRVEAETKRKAEAKDKAEKARIADLTHQKTVNRTAYEALEKALSEDLSRWTKDKTDSYGPEDVARMVVVSIATNKIPGIRMVY